MEGGLGGIYDRLGGMCDGRGGGSGGRGFMCAAPVVIGGGTDVASEFMTLCRCRKRRRYSARLSLKNSCLSFLSASVVQSSIENAAMAFFSSSNWTRRHMVSAITSAFVSDNYLYLCC